MQILSSGVGIVEGSCDVGVIDEIRLPGISCHPILLDIKTYSKATIPRKLGNEIEGFPFIIALAVREDNNDFLLDIT